MHIKKKTKTTVIPIKSEYFTEPKTCITGSVVFNTPELARMILWICSPATLACLAQVHTCYKEMALQILWANPADELALFKLLPDRVVAIEGRNVRFKDVTYLKSDWVTFSQYAPRVRVWEPEHRATFNAVQYWPRFPEPIHMFPRPNRINITVRDLGDLTLLHELLSDNLTALNIVNLLDQRKTTELFSLFFQILGFLKSRQLDLRQFHASGMVVLPVEFSAWLARRPALKEFSWKPQRLSTHLSPESMTAAIPTGRTQGYYPAIEMLRVGGGHAARILQETSAGLRLRTMALSVCDVSGATTILDLVGRECHGLTFFELTIEPYNPGNPSTITILPAHHLFTIPGLKAFLLYDHARIFPPPTEDFLQRAVQSWSNLEAFEWTTGVGQRRPGSFGLPSLNAIHLFSGCAHLRKLRIPIDTRLPLRMPVVGPRFHGEFILHVDETEWIAVDTLSVDKMVILFDVVHPVGRYGTRRPLGWIIKARDSERTKLKHVVLMKEVWKEVIVHASPRAKSPTHRIKRVKAAQSN